VRKILVGAGAAVILLFAITLLSGGQSNIDTFVAEAGNNGLPESFEGSATATVEVNDAPMLEIEFSEAIPGDETVELWLATEDFGDLFSLGTVPAGTTSWSGQWPSGLDPAVYVLVDLSLEPNDGDPTHSGRSFLRGELQPI